jgi:NodT family efflux transporter outer membrane factor (OMF) lipoprotein
VSIRTALVCGVGWAVGACTLTPPATPALPTPPVRYAEVGAWIAASPADETPRNAWWSRFGDPAVNELQDELSQGNPTLKIALDRLEEARQTARVAAGSLWPKLGLSVAATRSQASAESPSYSPNRANPIEDLSAAVTLSYEVDLFGRVRANAASARALAEAAAGDAAAVELALRAELINDYFQIRAIDAQLAVLEQTVDADARALTITENLVANGAGMPADIAQARSQLENTRAQLADARLRRSQSDHALAVLLGHPPVEAHQPVHPLPSTVPLPTVSPGLPSTLLQRRPDIAAAMRRVESARAAVGLARTAYFPVFSLGAALGRESTRTDTWFTGPARFWSLTPAMVATILDGGQRRAQTRGAVLALEESTENYRRTVLSAYQEVEDQLAAVRELDSAQASAEISAQSAEITLRHALHRYEAGAASYLEVAVAQNALLNSRLTAITLQYRRIASLTLLVRALGGSWS